MTSSPIKAQSGARIAFFYDSSEQALWTEELRQALPDARVSPWPQAQPDAEYAVAWSPTQAFIDAHPRLRYLFNLGAGVDALLKLQLPASLRVVRVEDAGMKEQMAEYATYAVLRHFREFAEYERTAAQSLWQRREALAREDFPIGVLGLGVLGGHVAQTLSRFGFPVRGWSQSAKTIEGVQAFAGASGLEPFLRGTRILVCLLPLTDATRGILNRETLSKLLPRAYLVNVARGGHLEEGDLLQLLDSGHLAGAMLDVTREEPLPPEHPFWRHPGIAITPHISAATPRKAAARQIAAKIALAEKGGTPSGVIDFARGY